ncbi:hypothetical protein [Sphingorhabdus sp. YGSMI21]|uniref:hypothetical protein n=1 Tax=Sphingorhabdus sp. YGSMI21 TaxID=2077182 RepID=UPI0013DA5E40|nr:hypothetical protein [Sphingorhabdus sp. YGSMI21]
MDKSLTIVGCVTTVETEKPAIYSKTTGTVDNVANNFIAHHAEALVEFGLDGGEKEMNL